MEAQQDFKELLELLTAHAVEYVIERNEPAGLAS